MKVLVTGASGLLGSNVVRVLLQDGYEVSVLLREQNPDPKTLVGLNIEKCFGDITDEESLDAAFKGKDYVIHAAAMIGLNPARSEKYREVNYEGAVNVKNAVLKNNIKRLVHVGTANSFGSGTIADPGTEERPYNSGGYGFDYMNAKQEAQQMLLKSVKEEGLPVVIVNPTMMIGPYDSRPSSGGVIMALYERKIPACTPGGRNYIGVRDAARATVNALTMGKIGECYILGEHNLTYREAFDIIAKTTGVKAPKLTLPAGIVKAFGSMNSMLGKVFKYTPAVTKEIAAVSCEYDYYSGEKARRELKMPSTPFEEAVKECFDWFKENGMC